MFHQRDEQFVAVVDVNDHHIVGAGFEKPVDNPDRFGILGGLPVFLRCHVYRSAVQLYVVELVVLQLGQIVVGDFEVAVLQLVDIAAVIELRKFDDDEFVGVARLLDGDVEIGCTVTADGSVQPVGDGA